MLMANQSKYSIQFCASRLLFALVMLSSICFFSCRRYASVAYKHGLKENRKCIEYPRRSTSYTRIGKTVFTDSVTGHRVKVEKYRRKISCFGSSSRRNILITYDSAGRRVSRENLLRHSICDTCARRRVRVQF